MKLDKFIKRPILSTVISVLIVLVGVISLLTLPVEKYPDIAPPTIEVSTNFYGANSETILKSVVTPLEDAIHGVENMIYMNSSVSNSGEITINVVFKQGTDANMAAVNVQNRVQQATPLMPAEVKQIGINVTKTQNSMLQIFSIYSPDDTYDFNFLSNYAAINIKPEIMMINGIGKFQQLGADYSMRIWLDPVALAQHSLVPDDVIAALSTQNIEAATGTFGENSDETYQYSLRYTGRLKSEEEFSNIIIRSNPDGTILRLGQVARVELGALTYNFTGETNSHPGVCCIAYQATGSNATKVNNEITAKLKKIKENAPSGIEIVQLMNSNDFLYSAIDQVLGTLRDAIILVILIVLMFLKDFRSTLIPFISIMVSLIGTFAFMTIAGFSINLLTLFALVLVIGTVVDDSIVVVEAVHSKFDAGITNPYKATKEATKEISTAVITSSLVFMAVFIPVSFMGGTSGVFYKQFGLTMAVAVGISALNALTLVPALCALILKPIKKLAPGEKGTLMQRYGRAFDKFFDKFSDSYKNGLGKILSRKSLIWIVSIAAFFLLVFFMKVMPSGLVPNEDQGSIMVELTTPPGTSLHATCELLHEVSGRVEKIPGIEAVSATGGFGFIAGMNSSAGILIIKLDPWDERSGETSLQGIYNKLMALSSEYNEANFLVFTMPMIPGYGTNSGVDMYIQDRRGGSIQELYDVTQDFIKELQKNGVGGYMAFNMDFPQWEVSVDVAKCLRSGLSPKEVLGTMGTYYGGAYVSDINLYSKVYKVMVQAEPDARRDEMAIDKTYVRTASGEMAPLSNFVSIKRVFGPDAIKTFNKYTAINVSAVTDLPSGKAIEVINKTAAEKLPEGYAVDYAGMSREQASQGGLGMILILCTFIIYLILAALYESFVIPFSVLLSVPLGLAASFGISSLVGLDNNIYLQTGVIMLIGLLAKTGILITEFAVDRHKQGLDIRESALEAARARLRPILMTAGTMVIGLLPLITSVGGVGGMGNFSLGLGTIVGMLVGTVGLLYIVPTLFTTFQKIQDKMDKNKVSYEDDEDEKDEE